MLTIEKMKAVEQVKIYIRKADDHLGAFVLQNMLASIIAKSPISSSNFGCQ
ncbi:MAG: hypothetical protein ACOX3A_01780 [bacterium]